MEQAPVFLPSDSGLWSSSNMIDKAQLEPSNDHFLEQPDEQDEIKLPLGSPLPNSLFTDEGPELSTLLQKVPEFENLRDYHAYADDMELDAQTDGSSKPVSFKDISEHLASLRSALASYLEAQQIFEKSMAASAATVPQARDYLAAKQQVLEMLINKHPLAFKSHASPVVPDNLQVSSLADEEEPRVEHSLMLVEQLARVAPSNSMLEDEAPTDFFSPDMEELIRQARHPHRPGHDGMQQEDLPPHRGSLIEDEAHPLAPLDFDELMGLRRLSDEVPPGD